MADITGHTPGPWTIYDDGGEEDSSDIIMAWIDDEDSGEKYDIAAMLLDRPIGERKANAEFIIRACNSHDALLEALEEYDLFSQQNDNWSDGDEFDVPEFVLKARAAIAKAKGGA